MIPQPAGRQPVAHVAVALVQRDRRWLVARRRPGTHLGGLWEFPGGKIMPGETPGDAARRELLEECGVAADLIGVLPSLNADYADRDVQITPVICRWSSGDPRPLASDECRWVTIDELRRLRMPPVNAHIVEAITSLP